MAIEDVWTRIERHAGETFRLKRGREFTYSVTGNYVDLDTTNRLIPRSDFARSLPRLPFASTTEPNELGVQGPSYVYALLMDPRIRAEDW